MSDTSTGAEKGALYSQALNELFELYSKLQSHNALLDKENAAAEINVGESSISVLDALHICDTLSKKIEVLGCIISKNDYSINIKELISTRDKLVEEYIALRKSIEVSDWNTSVE